MLLATVAADHAGGEAATFGNDIEAYEWGLAQYLGAGTAACYRGRRPYKDEPTRAMVTKWVSWFRAHRATLIQPIVSRTDVSGIWAAVSIDAKRSSCGQVHIRRADMQGWDGWLHVNPFALGAGNASNADHAEVGVAMLFNPTGSTLQVTVAVPVYYTGLTTSALVSVDDGAAKPMAVERDFSVRLALTMAPRSIHTATFARPRGL